MSLRDDIAIANKKSSKFLVKIGVLNQEDFLTAKFRIEPSPKKLISYIENKRYDENASVKVIISNISDSASDLIKLTTVKGKILHYAIKVLYMAFILLIISVILIA